jgi:hypothetical protein
MRRFRLRRLWKVNGEALVISAGQHLKRLLKKRGWGRRPFPSEVVCTSFWLLLGKVIIILARESSLLPIGCAPHHEKGVSSSLMISL